MGYNFLEKRIGFCNRFSEGGLDSKLVVVK